MTVVPINSSMPFERGEAEEQQADSYKGIRHGQILTTIIIVIFLYQFVNLPGAILSKSPLDIGAIMLGILLCMIAMLLNRLGWVMLVSILIIAVVDLGCGLMLLASPMGLDVSSMPVFDVLILSELIAASLLPARSVFVVATCNVLFTIGAIILMPHTPEMQMLLSSSMAYNVLIQPLCLQVIVAVVMYVWVHNTLKADVRAESAEVIIESRITKMEQQQQQLQLGIDQLLETVKQACNGNPTARINVERDNTLWHLSTALNILLARLQRLRGIEEENQRLQTQMYQLRAMMFKMKFEIPQKARPSSRSSEEVSQSFRA